MNNTGNQEKIEVLLQESQHVQDAISRTISQVYTIFGVIIPSVFGVALFLAEKKQGYLPIELLSLALVGLVSLSVLFCASLWMEAFEYLRYKYLVLLPRMYRIVGQGNEENFLQYGARTRKKETWLPTALFQLLIFLLAGAFAIHGILEGTEDNYPRRIYFFVITFVLLFAAAVGLVSTWRSGLANMKMLDRTSIDCNNSNIG